MTDHRVGTASTSVKDRIVCNKIDALSERQTERDRERERERGDKHRSFGNLVECVLALFEPFRITACRQVVGHLT